MQKILISVLIFYQKSISPYLTLCSCKFWPTCSEYSVLSIKKYGVFKGLAKTVCRLLRCNPFNKGGIDLP